MKPPEEMNVIDTHGGFTACTSKGTLWRPIAVLKHGTVGTLISFDEHSFYQSNDDVTQAWYKLPHYSYRVAVWFDNLTHQRIA